MYALYTYNIISMILFRIKLKPYTTMHLFVIIQKQNFSFLKKKIFHLNVQSKIIEII